MVEAIRRKRRQYFTRDGVRKPEYCTMKNTREMCDLKRTNVKGVVYVKYPTLSELHEYLFGYTPKGTHNSMADVLICLRCYLAVEHEFDLVKCHPRTAKLYELLCS
jgi:hypothetical protein